MDDELGTLKHQEVLYDDNFNEIGKIIIFDRGISLKYKDYSIKVPFNFIAGITKNHDVGLGKVNINLSIYDRLSNRYDLNMNVSDIVYYTLKRRWEDFKDE